MGLLSMQGNTLSSPGKFRSTIICPQSDLILWKFHREHDCPCACVKKAGGHPSNQANKLPAAKAG